MSERILDALRRTLGENLRFATIALRAHKLRAFLTIVGIVIGVWTVIAMVALVTGFNRSTMEAFSSFGTTLVRGDHRTRQGVDRAYRRPPDPSHPEQPRPWGRDA